MRQTPLRILHLEDSPLDAELIDSTLEAHGIRRETVLTDNRKGYLTALEEGGFDLILADYSLPSFDGVSALDLAREKCPDVPFIFVSATLGEELAVETLKGGATDYVLKQRLWRLGPSVQRALREVEERLDRQQAQETLRQRERQLRESQKMEALGRLAGGIAHDFNNLLTVIIGSSQALLNELPKDHPFTTRLRETHKAGTQAETLIRQLLALSRRQVLNHKVLDLNFVIEHVEIMLGRLIGEHIKLVVHKDPMLGRVRADRGQLDQVLMNLVLNARDAMPQGGTLTIETTNTDIPSVSPTNQSVCEPGRYVTLSVRDTGCGMPAGTQARIFEPFFTTKEEGSGTGLGLSMVHGIVQQSGGWIGVTSEPGQGAIFTLYLPRTEDPLPPPEPTKPSDRVPHGTETILLAEDNAGVRGHVRHELERLGYVVLEARNAVEALSISNQQAGPIDLLLTDVVMPGMSGRDLAVQLTATRPTTKVLYMSGYTDDVPVGEDLDLAKASFLQKPFTPDVLGCKIRELLDG